LPRIYLLCILLVLAPAMVGCGNSSSRASYSFDHSFSLTYSSSLHVHVQSSTASTAPDIGFFDTSNSELFSIRAENDPSHMTARQYILRRILHVHTTVPNGDAVAFASLRARDVVLDHVHGFSYEIGNGRDLIEAIVVAAHGRMYLLFGFEQSGINDLNGVLNSVRLT
jgi:hypothetical protein